jgi:hypothetical protein
MAESAGNTKFRGFYKATRESVENAAPLAHQYDSGTIVEYQCVISSKEFTTQPS